MAQSSEVSEENGQVIDLTQAHYTAEDDLAALPVRTPGQAYSDEEEGRASSSPGDGAAEIKSALAAYDRGRRSADDPDRRPDLEDRADEEWS
jgi:hypothetical protein